MTDLPYPRANRRLPSAAAIILALTLSLLVLPAALVAITLGLGLRPLPYELFVVLQRLPLVFPLHMIASGLALILIPIAAFARPWRGVHRAAGRLAAAAVVIGGLTALPVALASEATAVARAGLFTQGRGLARPPGGRHRRHPPPRGFASRPHDDRHGGGGVRRHLAAAGHVRRQHSPGWPFESGLRGRGLGLLARSAGDRRDRAASTPRDSAWRPRSCAAMAQARERPVALALIAAIWVVWRWQGSTTRAFESRPLPPLRHQLRERSAESP